MDSAAKKRIGALLRERELLLKRRPELRKMQKEIDKVLEEIGDDPEKRSEVLNKMLVKLISEKLVPAILEFNKELKKATRLCRTKSEESLISKYYLKKISNF